MLHASCCEGKSFPRISIYIRRKKLSIIFCVTKAYKNSHPISCQLTILKFLGRVFWKDLKLLKFGGFRLWATEYTKCHSWIFAIFLNVSLPLVFCRAQKIILANKQNGKWKKEACPMNKWKRSWKTVLQLSCALLYIIFILHWFLLKPKFFDNFWNRQYLNNSGVNF